jgi:hypothetical protein
VPRFTYAGPAEQVFPQYIDISQGSTLVAVPGETYDLEQVAGLTVPDGHGGLDDLELPMPPNKNFKPAKAPAQRAAAASQSEENG